MLREFDERDPQGWRPSQVAQYFIGGVAALFILALLISAYSAIAG